MPRTRITERGVITEPGSGCSIEIPVSIDNTTTFTQPVTSSGDQVYSGSVVFVNTASFSGPAEFSGPSTFDSDVLVNGDLSAGNVDLTGSFRSQKGIVFFTPTELSDSGLISIDAPGIYKFTAGVETTGSLPNPSSFPGGEFIFLMDNTKGHALTCSSPADPAFPNVFVWSDGQPPVPGSKLSMPTEVSASVILKSDSVRYFVMASSGSITIE